MLQVFAKSRRSKSSYTRLILAVELKSAPSKAMSCTAFPDRSAIPANWWN
jgi:hypothetical protein